MRCGPVTSPTHIAETSVTYLRSILDEHSDRVLSYAVADHMRDELVVATLQMAFTTWAQNTFGIIFHTD